VEKPVILTGRVVKGNQLGRTIGFPTANLAPGTLIPSNLINGVYAVKVKFRMKEFNGMANIGIRPTLENQLRTIEVNIFDFSEDIYGETISICFYEYIREERKFPGMEALKEQIRKDKTLIEQLLFQRMEADPDPE
jgi:riboflavin kinase / FMN adenylyltransferase